VRNHQHSFNGKDMLIITDPDLNHAVEDYKANMLPLKEILVKYNLKPFYFYALLKMLGLKRQNRIRIYRPTKKHHVESWTTPGRLLKLAHPPGDHRKKIILAINAYIRGDTLAVIQRNIGVSRNTLYKWLTLLDLKEYMQCSK